MGCIGRLWRLSPTSNLAPSLVSWSTSSLPSIPVCPGRHRTRIMPRCASPVFWNVRNVTNDDGCAVEPMQSMTDVLSIQAIIPSIGRRCATTTRKPSRVPSVSTSNTSPLPICPRPFAISCCRQQTAYPNPFAWVVVCSCVSPKKSIAVSLA